MPRNVIASILLISSTLIASSAFAVETTPVSRLPNKGLFTLSGTVDQVKDTNEFVLRDDSGSIDVKVPASESVVIKKGDNVTVTGNVESGLWGLLGKNIQATNVEVKKDLTSAISDAVTQATGLSVDKAETASINTLPEEGMVKLTGTVDQVQSEKDFVLKDPTGSVAVNIQSDDNLVLAPGTEVSVIGYVSNTNLGKEVNATRVFLMSDASTTAQTN
jgi:uncharacterized protein YdeI (BOF family)